MNNWENFYTFPKPEPDEILETIKKLKKENQ